MKKNIKSLLVISGGLMLSLVSCNSKESSIIEQDSNVASISIKTLPNNTTYKLNQLFDSKGLVVVKEMKDGSKVELTSKEYSIDYSTINNNKGGTYKVNVYLVEEPTISTSFDITYIVPTSISLKEGYPTKFLQYSEIDESNFEFEVTYSDGSKESVDIYELGFDNLDTYTTGEKEVEFSYSFYNDGQYDTLLTSANISVYDPTKLNVSSFELQNKPTNLTLSIDDKCYADQYFMDLVGYVKFNETNDTIFEVKDSFYLEDKLEIDYSNVYEATSEGTYNVVVSYHDKNEFVPVKLVDVSSYSLDSYTFDKNAIPYETYYTGETIYEGELLNKLNVKCVYKKEGQDNITLPCVNFDYIYLDEIDLTKVGKANITFKDYKHPTLSFGYEVNVLEAPLPTDGLYVNLINYEKTIKVNNGIMSVIDYDTNDFVGSYTFDRIERNEDENGRKYLEIAYKDENLEREFYYQVYMDDNSLKSLYKIGNNDYFVSMEFNYLFTKQNLSFFAKDGVIVEESIPTEYNQMIQYLYNNYVFTLDDGNNTIIEDPFTYKYNSNSKVIGKFNALSGEGKDFIGKYAGVGDMEVYTLVVEANKISIVTGVENVSVYEFAYRYEKINDTYYFTTDSIYKLEYSNGTFKLIVSFGEASQEYTFKK